MKIIAYGSRYGTAKRYADELARRTGIEARNYEEVDNVDDYETIIYIGALYAGGILGMRKTFSKIAPDASRKIVIASVGVTDPADAENIQNIRNNMATQLPQETFGKARIFHLRGGIDYGRLCFKHRILLKMMYSRGVKMPDEQKTAEVKAIIATYNQKADFVDFNSLDAIEQEIRKY